MAEGGRLERVFYKPTSIKDGEIVFSVEEPIQETVKFAP